jgi:hypothetical protein
MFTHKNQKASREIKRQKAKGKGQKVGILSFSEKAAQPSEFTFAF